MYQLEIPKKICEVVSVPDVAKSLKLYNLSASQTNLYKISIKNRKHINIKLLPKLQTLLFPLIHTNEI